MAAGGFCEQGGRLDAGSKSHVPWPIWTTALTNLNKSKLIRLANFNATLDFAIALASNAHLLYA